MYRIIIFSFISFLIIASCSISVEKSTLSPTQRAEKLTAQLSLSEKVAQLKNSSYATIITYVSEIGVVNVDSLKKYFPDGVGGLCIDKGLDPKVYMQVAESINQYNKTTRMAIPALYMGEALHGYMAMGATVFPQAIALGCSWDPALLEKCYDAAAREASSRGVKQILSPILDLGREPRFGRIEEMYSEDTYLVGEYGKAAVWGLQGRDGKPDSNHVAATLKHFMGHGIPEGGRNIAPVNISQYDLLNEHMPPFAQSINSGVISVMPSYNEINGVPNHANSWLLNDILKKELGFYGLITSDQNAIDEMYRTHAIAPSAAEAAKLAIENDVNVDIRYISGTYDELENLVKSGRLDEKIIDQSVVKLLSLKFRLGLFENNALDVKHMMDVTNCDAHKKLALEAAEKSLVLLKNNDNTLPFIKDKIKTVAVIGPLAKGVNYGGYTAEPRYDGIDVLEGIQTVANGKFKVLYAEGCKIAKEESSFWGNEIHTPNDVESDQLLIADAVKIARASDVIVLAIGETVSFSREAWGENHLGDRESLDLLGMQNELAEALLKTGKPIVALMFGGRPLSFNYVAENIPSIIQVFYPGQEGGTAIANVLFGNVNPSGKLGTTIPKSVGNLPCYYSRKPSRMRSYIHNMGVNYLYPFGFGLSYTSFSYSHLSLDTTQLISSGEVIASVKITNTGAQQGEEIVQLYIRDVVSSAVRPVMELKDFKRVALNPGETKQVDFTINREKLEYYNAQLKKVLEPGEFKVMVGPSSVEYQSLTFTVN